MTRRWSRTTLLHRRRTQFKRAVLPPISPLSSRILQRSSSPCGFRLLGVSYSDNLRTPLLHGRRTQFKRAVLPPISPLSSRILQRSSSPCGFRLLGVSYSENL